jgi:hypothetical protein
MALGLSVLRMEEEDDDDDDDDDNDVMHDGIGTAISSSSHNRRLLDGIDDSDDNTFSHNLSLRPAVPPSMSYANRYRQSSHTLDIMQVLYIYNITILYMYIYNITIIYIIT